jgi:hypothetical protein
MEAKELFFGLPHFWMHSYELDSMAMMMKLSFARVAFVVCSLLMLASAHAGNPLTGIRHMLRRHDENSYSEAYVTMMAPNTRSTVDHKALLRGLTTAKNCIGRISTFDSNEYAQIDDPMRLGGNLGFVVPPAIPLSTTSPFTKKH